jgi:hypothetical protein
MPEIAGPNHTVTGKRIGWWYLLVLVGAGSLYVLTCAPAILWQDSSLFAYRIWHNDIRGDMGLALAHPLYVMIGVVVKQIPVGDLAYKLNLASAVFAALAVANLFLLVRLWIGRTLPALVSAITLAVSWTFWQQAVGAEAYSLYAAQMFAELIMLLQYVRTKRVRYLYLLGFLNGLAVANHMWAVFGLICYTVVLIALLDRRQISLKNVGLVVLLWLIGAGPYEYLIIERAVVSGDIQGALASALFGNLWQGAVLNASVSLKIVLENMAFILLNFPTPNFVLLLVGMWVLRKKAPSRGFANVVATLLILYFLFAFRYTVVDRYVFFLPFYCLISVLIGLGAHITFERYRRKSLVFLVLVFALLPVPTYAVTPALARKAYAPLGRRRQRPYRDEYKYFLQPWKAGYRGAQRFSDEALEMVEENAIIYADSTIIHTLLYVQQAQAKRPDVKIVSGYYWNENAPAFNEDTIGELMQTCAVYVVSPKRGYCPVFILDNYDTVQKGVLHRVIERGSGG